MPTTTMKHVKVLADRGDKVSREVHIEPGMAKLRNGNMASGILLMLRKDGKETVTLLTPEEAVQIGIALIFHGESY